MTERHWRTTYEKVAPFLVVFCLMCVPVFSAVTFALNQQQNQESKDRDRAFSTLVGCLDDYVTSLSTSLPKVRAASARSDAATTAHVAAVEDWAKQWTDIIATANRGEQVTHDDVVRLERAGTRLTVASKARIRAAAALNRARAENPLPTPGDFCGGQ